MKRHFVQVSSLTSFHLTTRAYLPSSTLGENVTEHIPMSDTGDESALSSSTTVVTISMAGVVSKLL